MWPMTGVGCWASVGHVTFFVWPSCWVSTQWLSSSKWLPRGGRRFRCVHFCALHSQYLPETVDQFSAPFPVVKQYHIAGTTVVNSCLKIRNNHGRDFSLKMTFIRMLKIFWEFGMCSKSLGTNWTPRQKRVQLERLEKWILPKLLWDMG